MTFNNSRRSWISRFFGANAAVPTKGKRAIALESLEDRLTPATWYIDPINGSNSGAGTQADPWATLQASLDKPAVTDGDELLISPGSMTEQGTAWTANTETVSVLIQKSVAIRGTDAAWNPITDTSAIQAVISLGSQGSGSQALLVVDAPDVTITGLQFDPINADAGNPVNGQGQLIFVLGNNVVLQDLNINTNRANAETQAVPGTTATAVYFYDPNPTLNAGEIVSSSISTYLVTENLINGTVVISNGTGFGQPTAGQLITNNQISKGLFGAVYLFGEYNDPNSTSIYDVGLPTMTGNIISTFPFPTNPSDDVPGNFGAFQSLYRDQANRPSLAYIQTALASNTVVNYTAVSTPGGDIRQQGDAATNYGFNVFPYLQALSAVVEQFLDANNPAASPVQSGDTINVAAPDIDPNVLNYNLLSANGAIVRVTGADPLAGFEVTLSEYMAPGGTGPNALSMTFARDTNLVPNSVLLSVFGNSANNTLTGDPGNNAFTGGAGNDVIDGVAGIDTVNFSGSFTDYSFSYNSTTGILQVVDNRPGSPDGTDQLKGIEYLVFDNGGLPQNVAVADTGTTIQSGIDDLSTIGVLIMGTHSAEDVVVNRDVVLRGVADAATSTTPTANSFLLTNSAILQVGSGNVTAPLVDVNFGSLISDGVLLTSAGGTLNVDAGTYPPVFTDNNVVFYRSITVNAIGGQVFADAFTLQDSAVLSGGFANFQAPSVTVNPGSLLSQGVAMTAPTGTLFAATGTYNEDVVLDKEMVLASLNGLVTINGSTTSPLVINNQSFATVFLEGPFNFTSTATPTPSIEVTPGSYLGLTGNGSTGTAIINLQGDLVDGGHLELYGPTGPGAQIVLNNRVVMGDNTSLYAQGTGIPDGGYTPTVSGILEYVAGANVTLGASGGTLATPSILTINGPIIDNGVSPVIDQAPPINQVIIQGALTAVLDSQDLYLLNSQTAVGSFTISVIINTAGSGVDTLTLPGALVAEFLDTNPVPVTATFTGFTPVGNGGIATYNITPNVPPFSSGPAGPYLFYLKGVQDNSANVLPDTLITQVQAEFTQPSVTVTPNTADPTNLESTNFTIQFSEGVTGLTVADLLVTGGVITNLVPDLFDTSLYTVTVAANGTGERVVAISVTVPAGSATDAFGNPNLAGTGNITFDNVRPTPTIAYSGASPTNISPLVFTITWDEIVTDFTATDVNLVNAALVPGTFQQLDPVTYTFQATPLVNGTVTVNIVDNIAQDLAQNPNKASNTVNVVFDDTQPTVTLTAPSLLPGNVTYNQTVVVTLTLDESVTLADSSQLIVTGGTAGAITQVSPLVWQVSVTVSTPGAITPITVQANQGLFEDLAGNLSQQSNLLSYTYRPAISQGLAWGSNGPSNGQGGNVVTIQAPNGNQTFVTVFPGWTGGVRVASGDVTGDGIQDYVVVPTAGGAPNVVVISGATNTSIASFYAMDPAYTGGLTVAVGDLNGDAIADIVVGTGGGAQATVATFAGQTFANLKNFFVYNGYTGQVNVGTADITGAGTGRSILTGTGVGAPPHVQVIDYTTLNVVSSFYAFPSTMTGGVYVSGGNLNTATPADEIVVGSGGGIQSTVNIFSPAGAQLNSLSVFPGFFGQTKVTVTDFQGDGVPDLAVGAGPGSDPEIDVLRGTDLAFIDLFYGYNLPFTQGINFGA